MVVVKEYNDFLSTNDTEAQRYSKFRNDCIVEFRGVCCSLNALVMEFCKVCLWSACSARASCRHSSSCSSAVTVVTVVVVVTVVIVVTVVVVVTVVIVVTVVVVVTVYVEWHPFAPTSSPGVTRTRTTCSSSRSPPSWTPCV